MAEETKTNELQQVTKLKEVYGSEEEGKYAVGLIQQINKDLETRETASMVFNGVKYSQGYAYNQRKAVNYAPPRNKNDDREVSLGMVHEKIVSFVAIFLKYVFKRRVKCYDNKGRVIKGLGEIYDLAIEFSYKLEKLKKKIALIYWELFTQGNAFVMEDWEVKMINTPKAYAMLDGKKTLVTPDNMDYTYEFLDGLDYEKGEDAQTRRAISVVLDGRNVIFGNPEIEEIQDQPRITLEDEITKADAEALYGTLKRWGSVPKSAEEINSVTGGKITLLDVSRNKDPNDKFIRHICYDKENNKFNIFLNGVMMLPMKTPMSIFHPRMNYPISNIPAERLRGSIYARSIPAKTKFNADFIDWALKMLADKFEQGVTPAILSKGKYTLTRNMFRGGQVTHGVSTSDYEKADPENKGVTQHEYSFVNLLKDILETQTLNPTTSGELSGNATATEIATTENNQITKLGFILDGLMNGFMDMAERRAETIETKYTIKQKETVVDGKKVPVYQNFTVNVSGVDNVVVWDEEVGMPHYDEEAKRDELFSQAFKDKKDGNPTEYYLANPTYIREGQYTVEVEIHPERVKDTAMQMIQLWDEFTQLLNTFGKDTDGGMVSMEQLKKEYLDVSGRSDKVFTSQVYQRLEKELGGQEGTGYNMGSFGRMRPAQKPTIRKAQQEVTKV